MKDRDESDAKHYHCKRQSEIKLDEAKPVTVTLSRSRKKRDRAGLRCHYRQTHMVPWQLTISKEIAFNIPEAAAFPYTLDNDEEQCETQYQPVDPVHL